MTCDAGRTEHRRGVTVDPAATTVTERLEILAGELLRAGSEHHLVRVERFDVLNGIAVFALRRRRPCGRLARAAQRLAGRT